MKNIYDEYLCTLRPLVPKNGIKGSFKLTKIEMLEALKHDTLTFHDKIYKTPEDQLLFLLTNNYCFLFNRSSVLHIG